MLRHAAALLLLSSFVSTSQAALIDHGSFTTDTSTNLDWLDVTQTINMGYNAVSAQLGTGGQFAGWRYATTAEVQGLFTTVGLPIEPQTYGGALPSAQASALSTLESLLGNTFASYNNGNPAYSDWSGIEGLTSKAVVNVLSGHQRLGAYTFNYGGPNYAMETDSTLIQYDTSGQSTVGSYLVRPSEVPLPAAGWLLISGLCGLGTMTRRNGNRKTC